MKNKSRTKVPTKTKAAMDVRDVPSKVMSKSLGELKVTYGSKQSYIQQKIDDVWRLLIAVSEKQSADHARMIDALLQEAQKPKASKDAMVKKRASLIVAR